MTKIRLEDFGYEPVSYCEAVLLHLGTVEVPDEQAIWDLAVQTRNTWLKEAHWGEGLAKLELLMKLEDALERVGVGESCCRA